MKQYDNSENKLKIWDFNSYFFPCHEIYDGIFEKHYAVYTLAEIIINIIAF